MELSDQGRGAVVIGLNAWVFGPILTAVTIIIVLVGAWLYAPHSSVEKEQSRYCQQQRDAGVAPSPGSACDPNAR